MKKLLIDTATEGLALILSEDGKLTDYYYEIVKRDHSTRLMPCIDKLLTKNNWDIKDINEIQVTEGPGSYTGVRIGVTVAKTLSYALNIPLTKISTLKFLSGALINRAKYIVPLIDARRGNVFGALYRVINQKLIVVLEEKLYNYQELVSQIKRIKDDDVYLIGMDLDKFKVNDAAFHFLSIKDYFNPESVLKLDFEKVDNVHTFVPNYKRLPEAELNLNE